MPVCVVVLLVVRTFIFLIAAERFGCFPDMTSSLAKCKQTSGAHLKDDFWQIAYFCDIPQYSNVFYYIKHKWRAVYFNNQKNRCTWSLKLPNSAKLGKITAIIRRSRSFEVTDFVTNGKPVCDFLCANNCNLPHLALSPRDGGAKHMSLLVIFFR